MAEKKKTRKTAKATKATKTAKAEPKAKAPKAEGKMSALDAAVMVLMEEKRPMTCKELIEAMAAKGYWSTPAGKTPEATLSSAIGADIRKKGDSSRFEKTGPGQFAVRV